MPLWQAQEGGVCRGSLSLRAGRHAPCRLPCGLAAARAAFAQALIRPASCSTTPVRERELRRHMPTLTRAFLTGDFTAASDAATAFSKPLRVAVVEDASLIKSQAIWEAVSATECVISTCRETMTGGQRLPPMLRLIEAYHACRGFIPGRVMMNLGDAGHTPGGLAFCAATPDFTLVPDPEFLQSDGYLSTKQRLIEKAIPWEERIPIAVFRGGTTGRFVVNDWRAIQRIRLCEIAEDEPTIDAGITDFIHLTDPQVQADIRKTGFIRDRIPQEDFQKWQYQIDIDGYTNSWSGLFRKLLTGSPVLKVASPYGYRQWYYRRLRPWENCVPVSATMDDLVEKVRWLIRNDSIAQAIGRRGQAFAGALTVGMEVRHVLPDIAQTFLMGTEAWKQISAPVQCTYNSASRSERA